MSTRQTALVTGGGGFLGSAIVRMLVENGTAVRTFSRSTYAELEHLGVKQIQGDISRLESVLPACEGVDVVFHTAAKPGVGGAYETYYATNVLGTQNILQACRQCKVARLIHTSSPSVIFDGGDMEGVDESVPYPATYHAHYPKTKAIAEKMVLEASAQGLPTIILRPHLIWGPGDNHLVPGIISRASRLRRIGAGANTVDTIYIDNAAKAHLLADQVLQRNPALSGKVYFISQDAPVRVWDMVDMILAAAGKPPVGKTISPKLAIFIGWVFEKLYHLLRIEEDPPMTRFMARELSTSHWFDISAAKRDLGYSPDIGLEEGLKRLAVWLGH